MDHPTFAVIGSALGISEEQARWYYKSGMAKLRKKPLALRHMRSLAHGLHRSPVIETNEELD